MKEVERKFLFEGTDDLFVGVPVMKVRQVYLSIKPELRLREVLCKGVLKYYLTAKGDGDLDRDEYEIEISHEAFNELVAHNSFTEITKSRYRVPIDENTAIVDIFDNSDLKTVEVEFSDNEAKKLTAKEQALAFEPLDWFGKEVTINPMYKNKCIAKYGFPVAPKVCVK